MQHAQIDSSGTTFAYLDSGAPPGDAAYTTLVCVHGHSYHAQSFARLAPRAAAHGLRVIALNRRDYAGSTPLAPAELAALRGPDPAPFLRARGLELARFLAWVVAEKRIPPARADRGGGGAGGLALLGWSLGNVTTLAFLGHLRTYPRALVDALEPYLRTFFLYELPDNTLGHSAPAGGYHPLDDTSVPARLRGLHLGRWVSSYYAHPAYAPGAAPAAAGAARSVSALQVRAPPAPDRACTLNTLSPKDLLACVDAAPGERSERAFWRLPLPVLRVQTRGALLLDDDAGAPGTSGDGGDSDGGGGAAAALGDDGEALLPALRLCAVYGCASPWTVQWETWALEADCARWRAEGRRVRPVAFVPVDGANHFLHWEDAETFVRICAEGIRGFRESADSGMANSV
ncbi:hypothetical protein DFH11DRAFT_1725694 [Phellopilus nigrolimitatus]|nr:hypothetical protein DFH11DRAFT_1725694 [Phellopilus nigrolimitatus]